MKLIIDDTYYLVHRKFMYRYHRNFNLIYEVDVEITHKVTNIYARVLFLR